VQDGVKRTLAKLPQVMTRTDLKKSTIYFWMSRGKFPKPMKIGDRAVAWRIADIEAWEAAQRPASELSAT